jgi:hypothetical protein
VIELIEFIPGAIAFGILMLVPSAIIASIVSGAVAIFGIKASETRPGSPIARAFWITFGIASLFLVPYGMIVSPLARMTGW